jgi:hypothetical protein
MRMPFVMGTHRSKRKSQEPRAKRADRADRAERAERALRAERAFSNLRARLRVLNPINYGKEREKGGDPRQGRSASLPPPLTHHYHLQNWCMAVVWKSRPLIISISVCPTSKLIGRKLWMWNKAIINAQGCVIGLDLDRRSETKLKAQKSARTMKDMKDSG